MMGMMGKVGVAKRQGQRNEGDKAMTGMTGHRKVGVANNGDKAMTGTMK
jgi:hypothetical protein